MSVVLCFFAGVLTTLVVIAVGVSVAYNWPEPKNKYEDDDE